jgi:hypothetical protein
VAADGIVAAGYTQKLCVSGRSIKALVLARSHRIDQLARAPGQRIVVQRP